MGVERLSLHVTQAGARLITEVRHTNLKRRRVQLPQQALHIEICRLRGNVGRERRELFRLRPFACEVIALRLFKGHRWNFCRGEPQDEQHPALHGDDVIRVLAVVGVDPDNMRRSLGPC